MKIPISQIPEKIMTLYNLELLMHKGAVCVNSEKALCLAI